MVINKATKLRVNNLINRGRIVFGGSQKLEAEGLLTNNGIIYLANPGAPEPTMADPLSRLNIVNNGTISTSAVSMTALGAGNVNVGVLYGNLHFGVGSVISIIAPTTPGETLIRPSVSKAAVAPGVVTTTPIIPPDPLVTPSAAYMTVNSLGSVSGKLDLDVLQNYYGQYTSPFAVSIGGATLQVDSFFNHLGTEEFDIVKAPNIGGSGFGPSIYTPTGYSYAPHSMSTSRVTCGSSICYRISNTAPTP